MAILDIQHLSVGYEGETYTVHAVDDVTLAVAEGQSLGLIGESGCGKTTLSACDCACDGGERPHPLG